MNEDKRDTVGAISSALLEHQIHDDHSADEQMREQLTDYEKNIELCVDSGLKTYTHNFYVVVLTKKERLMQNVIRNYFFHRSTCPTPEYDQIVYQFMRSAHTLEFLWVIPSKETCEYMRNNPLSIPESERELLNFVLDFYENSLLTMAKLKNSEHAESPLIM